MLTNKKFIKVVVFVTVVSGGFLFFSSLGKDKTIQPVEDKQVAKQFVFEQKNETSSQDKKYKIDFDYPFFTGQTQAEKDINKTLENFRRTLIEENKKNFEEMIMDPFLQGSASVGDLGVIAKYTISQNDQLDVLNVMYEVYVSAGGAHGITGVSYFIFDKKTGKVLSFEDIFVSKEKALSKLSELSFAEIKKVDPDLEIYTEAQEGTKPTEENFQNFALDASGLKIKFGDYQIGSYAVGRLEITLPFESLKDVLKEEFKK